MYYLNIQQLKFQVFLMSLLLKLAALFIYEMIGADKLKKGIVFLSGICLVGTVKGEKTCVAKRLTYYCNSSINQSMRRVQMDKRVQFDFEIKFTNGGGLQGQEFRLDIDGDDITDQELAKYIVEDMRLLMVGEVKIFNKKIINEKHKRKPVDENSGK